MGSMSLSESNTRTRVKHPVIIIGAGFTGLCALKTMKENGLQAVCFEKTDNFGGLWRFREGDYNGVASVTRTTIINSSKEISAFSDFPPAANLANYMHNSSLLHYLQMYAEKFDLLKDVNLRHEVISVTKADDYQVTGEWTVHLRRYTDDHLNTHFEDYVLQASAVLVCIGRHVYPNVPNFLGQSDFQGEIMHTHSYKDSSTFAQKRVLVVGIGNSGMDAASEVSLVASQVYLSTRRGGWILQRVGPKGIPIDFARTRFSAFMYKMFPSYSVRQMEKMINSNFDHELYNLKPKHRYDGQHPSLSDLLPSRIIGGAVIVKSDVQKFTKHGVTFKGEPNCEYQVDAVILATGYDIRIPIVNDDIISAHDKNKIDLYRRMIPPKIAAEHPTLAFVGFIHPIGSLFPVVEMQCRWMAKVLKGEIHLPSQEHIYEEVRHYESNLRARYVDSQRHTIQVDMVPYMDSLAKDIGCKPNLVKLFLTDNQLFWRVLFGPAVAYQYRLTGPHAWPGARDAIMTVTDRMRAAFNTRVTDQVPQPSKASNWWKRSMATYMSLSVGIGIYAYYAISDNSGVVSQMADVNSFLITNYSQNHYFKYLYESISRFS